MSTCTSCSAAGSATSVARDGRRLDAELVARGLARSRAEARELVVAGSVLVAGRPVTKPSTAVAGDDVIELSHSPERWVGRAAVKLLRALELWPIPVAGRRCLDVGASTGGFTQVLLEAGAAHVTALDVGHHQLVPSISGDPRVTDRPGTNIRSVTAHDLGGRFDLVVCDLSFISLTIALPGMRPLVHDDGNLVMLVKPQFEVGRERLGRRGVVTSPHEHRRVLISVAECATDLALELRGAAPSPIEGAGGNREFLLWLSPRSGGGTPAGMPLATAREHLIEWALAATDNGAPNTIGALAASRELDATGAPTDNEPPDTIGAVNARHDGRAADDMLGLMDLRTRAEHRPGAAGP